MKPVPFSVFLAGSAVIAALLIGGLIVLGRGKSDDDYVTAVIGRGRIERVVTASGSVNPEITVQVGAFISGTIKTLTCDFNTEVKKGQVCATIDPRPYQLALDQAKANLANAKAQRAKDQAALDYAELNYRRLAGLLALDSIARDAADVALSTRDQARAQAALDETVIRQRQAALTEAEVNLGYAEITSPVDGVVVSRNVTVGQTVASSFQTPTLFLIAQDLKRMQIDANVSETDIGATVAGAKASFTVDAFPGRVFRGIVTQVRQAPISVQNVITYDVVIATDNADLSLKPGMTATARIVTGERDDVLRAPLPALRFTPAGEGRSSASGGPVRAAASAPQRIWVLKDGKLRAAAVRVGLMDDAYAEILGGDLSVGDVVVLSSKQGRSAARTAASPLAGGR